MTLNAAICAIIIFINIHLLNDMDMLYRANELVGFDVKRIKGQAFLLLKILITINLIKKTVFKSKIRVSSFGSPLRGIKNKKKKNE